MFNLKEIFDFDKVDAAVHRLYLFTIFRWFYALLFFLYALMSFLSTKMNLVNYFYWILIIASVAIFNISAKLKSSVSDVVSEDFLLIQSMFDYLIISASLYLIFLFKGIESVRVELFFFPLVISLLLLNIRQSLISFFIFILYQILFAILAQNGSLFFWSDLKFFSMLLTSSILCSSLLFVKIKLMAYDKRLKQMTEKSFRAEHLKLVGAMTAGFCHEMATPVNTIKMNFERLKNKEEFLKESVEIGLSSVVQIEKSLRSLNEIHKNKFSHSVEKINIVPVFESLMQEFNSHKFQFEVTDEAYEIISNRSVFTKVIFDLLINALEASSESGLIEVGLSKKNNKVILEIRNEGTLFPDFVLKHFGEPFVTAKTNGNGLGLFNAYNYALSMEGQLKIFNENKKAVVSMEIKGV